VPDESTGVVKRKRLIQKAIDIRIGPVFEKYLA
jgi:hypothetical protein